MDRSRALAVLALGALLLLAGCQAPGTPQDADFAPSISVVNATGAERGTTIDVAGNETIDPGAVFAQVQGLLGTDVPPPTNVRVLDDLSDLTTNTSTFEMPIRRHLNVTSRGDLDLGDQENGAVNALGGITIYPGQARDPQATTWVLAHELVHYVHVRGGQAAHVRETAGMDTTDGQFTSRAMIEGTAMYTTEAYLDEYVDNESATTLALYQRIERGLPPGSAGTYANRQYLLGHHYISTQVNSSAEIDRLYNHTAVTSEQLIHGDDPAAEPMAALDVSYDGGEAWTVTGSDRMGEAFTWTALEDHLGTDRAAEAAAGWGNDSLLTVYPTDEGNVSFAWVLRWDDATNASEFADNARTYLERAGTSAGDLQQLPTGAHADLATAGDRTTVLTIGEREFVTETTVSATGNNVTVATAE